MKYIINKRFHSFYFYLLLFVFLSILWYNEKNDIKGVFMTYPNLLERFLTYVKVNTRSDEHSTTTPSTQSQVDFATNILIPEMKRVGL